MTEEMTVYFSGDTCINGQFAKNIEAGKALFSESLRDLLIIPDFHITNFEGPLSDNVPLLTIENSQAGLQYLMENNISHYSLANNHIFDKGVNAYRNTSNKIKKLGAQTIGAGENREEAAQFVVLKKNNVRLGLVAICDDSKEISGDEKPGVFHLMQKELLIQASRQAREKTDHLGIIVHLGEEYTLIPSPRKQKTIQWIIKKCKPDFIIAHHSHTFQTVKQVDGIPVFYSLGNFIFDWPTHRYYSYTDVSAIIKFNITKKTIKYSFIPLKMDRDNGLIDKLPEHEWNKHFAMINVPLGRKIWRKEAHRVIFNRIKPKSQKISAGAPLKKKRLHLFKRILTIIGNQTLRDIYIPAILYKVLHVFNKR